MQGLQGMESLLDLRRLRYFVTVAEAASFSRAADRLGMAQPPLSQQIKALETQLGERLFIRHARTIELTDAGRALLAEAEPLLTQAGTIPERVRRAAEGHKGRISIGFTPATALHPLLPVVLRAFRTAAPQVDIVFKEDDGIQLCDAVAEGRIQIAFVRPPAPPRDRLKLHTLAVEPIMAALPRDHPLASRSALTLSDIAGENIVLFERALAPELYDDILAAFSNAALVPRIVHHAPQKASAMMLAAGGVGITLVPASLRGIHTDALSLLAIDGLATDAAIAVVHREGEQGAIACNIINIARRLGR